MNILAIAFNNLKRRWVKMLILTLGLAVGIATVVGFLSIIEAMNKELGDRIDEFGANAVILPRSEGLEVSYGHGSSDLVFDVETLTMDDVPKIYTSSVEEFINIVSPKLVGTVQAAGQPALLVGVETRQEFTQKPWITLAQGLNGQTDLALVDLPEDGLILGSSASRVLGVDVGQELLINDQYFHVYGILNELGSEEDGLIYANLGAVQELMGRPGELSMIEISAYCNYCPIEEIAVGLEDAIPTSRVIPIREAALFREETIDQFASFGLALAGMVLVIAALVVLTTMLSSVNERTREIGIFRAIGFRKSHIVSIIFLEAGMISILAGTIGFLLGSWVARFAGPYLAQIQGQVPMQVDFLLPAILLSAGLAILASAYPALKAAKLDPAEALRFI